MMLPQAASEGRPSNALLLGLLKHEVAIYETVEKHFEIIRIRDILPCCDRR